MNDENENPSPGGAQIGCLIIVILGAVWMAVAIVAQLICLFFLGC